MISTTAGLTVLLILLLAAAHVLLALHTSSTASAVAVAAARQVASARVDHGDPRALALARADAERRALAALGSAASSASVEWPPSTGGRVAVRVSVDGPRLLPGGTRLALPFERIERSASVRTEELR